MRRFELLEPRSIDEAVALLGRYPEAKVIAGGTALLILIKQNIYVPERLINLKKIGAAAGITYDPETGLRIEALTSIDAVERDPHVRAHYPVLARACHVVANIRIRNLATIGGNVAHADYQSDPPSALLALGARVELRSERGVREVELEAFLIGTYETQLEPDELLTAILVPPVPIAPQASYLKFTTRSSEDRPAAGVTALLYTSGGRITDSRLVVGAVSPAPVRITEAETIARDAEPGPPVFAAMAAAASRAVDPLEDLHGGAAYKRQLVGVLAERALRAAMEVQVR